MDAPIRFKVPNKTLNVDKSSNMTFVEKQNEIKEDKLTNALASTYSQVCPNVFKFNNVQIYPNINVKFSEACELRKNRQFEKSLDLFKKCESEINDKTDNNLKYEIYVNIALIHTETNENEAQHKNETIIKHYYDKAIEICPDRAEPLYYLSLYYIKHLKYDEAYILLKRILMLSYEDAQRKYGNVQENAYGYNVLDDLLVVCFYTKKYEESIEYIEEIIRKLESAGNNKYYNNIAQMKSCITYIRSQLNDL